MRYQVVVCSWLWRDLCGCERADNVALCSAGSGPLHREKDSEGHDDLPDAVAAGAVATAGVSEGMIGLLEDRSLPAGEAREVAFRKVG